MQKQKGSRCQSGATAITVFGDVEIKAIERQLEKAFSPETLRPSARIPAYIGSRFILGHTEEQATVRHPAFRMSLDACLPYASKFLFGELADSGIILIRADLGDMACIAGG